MSDSETVDLAKALIACRSVAPDDDGAQALLKDRLDRLGFRVHDLPCGGRRHFWAEKGDEGPLLAIAMHTDVVPEGEASRWTSPPFEPEIRNGQLFGRGAVDMKSQIACVITALEDVAKEKAGFPAGFRLGILVTGDEEVDENLGADAILDFLETRRTPIDYCLVTEPTSQSVFGDTIRIGRRGSLHGRVRIVGEQRHSSFPDQRINPIYLSLPVFTELAANTWCAGNSHFPPTTFQFTSIQADGGASNTTPAVLQAEFNLRFSNELTAEGLQGRIGEVFRRHGLDHSLEWICNAHPFLTIPGSFSEYVSDAVQEIAGIVPEPSTGGGTSDGRFIAARGARVVEFGLVGRKSHMIDESAPLEEIDKLQRVYKRMFAGFAGFVSESAKAG